jgi:ABC-type lipoprotein export system ATPase subunit
MSDPRGSTWRKWDLHVHTPMSVVQLYGGDTDAVWEKYITDIESLAPEFKVIGINDYLFLDGYKKILEFRNAGRLRNIDLILPALEFRLDKFAGTDSRLRKINLHVIFSNMIDPGVIEEQFLNALTSKYKLSPGINGITWSGVITRKSIEDLGKKIKSTVPEEKIGQYGSDFEEGFNNLTLDEDDILKILKESSFFNTQSRALYLTAIGKTEWESLRWTDGSIADKKDIINKANIVFISSENLEQFQRAKNKLKEHKVNDLLLDCSDAKEFKNGDGKDRIGKCFTWIKADPTFEGLLQSLCEPEERIFVGEEPDIIARVRNNQTKYIKLVQIDRDDNSIYDEEIWFRGIQIDINPGLVAIIGNKGNGKSALSDILGLVGNTKNYQHFSFLNSDKFREKKNNKARYFRGRIIWASDDNHSRLLSENPEPHESENVKYIPQKYLEILCNEEKTEFDKELKKVIFSHVLVDDKLGQTSLDDLINFQSEVLADNISIYQENLSLINDEIAKLEDFLDEESQKSLAEKLKSRKHELEVHERAKPKAVIMPAMDKAGGAEIKRINDELSSLNTEKSKIEIEIKTNHKKKADLTRKKSILEKAMGEIDNFRSQFVSLLSRLSTELEEFSIEAKDIISLEVNEDELRTLQKSLKDEIAKITNSLSEEIEDSLINKLKRIDTAVNDLKGKLDEPHQKYQAYLKDLKTWEERKSEIIGDEERESTVTYLKNMQRYISEQVPSLLRTKREERLTITGKIFDKKEELINIFKSLYKPVDHFMTRYNSDEYPVNFDAKLEIEGLYEDFFLYVSQKAKGSFYGLEDGSKQLRDLCEETEFNSREGVLNLLRQIIERLEHDYRDDKKEKRVIKRQLRKDNIVEFYNYLFSLNYVIPKYTLRLGNTELNQLSPGEKGALLLIFYLLIDKNDIPLIIDQPEENLDNESVYKLLVNFIKIAKKKRQIIIVTHNPNLAVVCDAEQIIYSRIDKKAKNKVSYMSGSIENPELNKKLIDVLEGTMPAFNNRDTKYNIAGRS